jgi:hypothetical protein
MNVKDLVFIVTMSVMFICLVYKLFRVRCVCTFMICLCIDYIICLTSVIRRLVSSNDKLNSPMRIKLTN